MSRIAREPFLHFILLSVLIFAADAALRNRTTEVGEIVVTAGRIENLAALFARTRQRAPTDAELKALIDGYVLEEALYREGIALGVDQGDTVIRRRVRQKMDLLVDDVAVAGNAPEAELQSWFGMHADSYAEPARYSFRQVFFSAARHGDALGADMSRALEELQAASATADAQSLGDSSLFEFRYEDYDANAIASIFGEAFASDLASAPTGQWSGPIESTYGQHLVFVDARVPGRIPSLAEVRDEVERDWRYARGEEARQKFYEDVLARYDVTIEWPDSTEDIESAAGTELTGAASQ